MTYVVRMHQDPCKFPKSLKQQNSLSVQGDISDMGSIKLGFCFK